MPETISQINIRESFKKNGITAEGEVESEETRTWV